MMTRKLKQEHEQLGKGLHQVKEIGITKGGRVKTSYTRTRKLNKAGDFMVTKSVTYQNISPQIIKDLKAEGIPVTVKSTTKKTTGTKKDPAKKKPVAKKTLTKRKTAPKAKPKSKTKKK